MAALGSVIFNVPLLFGLNVGGIRNWQKGLKFSTALKYILIEWQGFFWYRLIRLIVAPSIISTFAGIVKWIAMPAYSANVIRKNIYSFCPVLCSSVLRFHTLWFCINVYLTRVLSPPMYVWILNLCCRKPLLSPDAGVYWNKDWHYYGIFLN